MYNITNLGMIICISTWKYSYIEMMIKYYHIHTYLYYCIANIDETSQVVLQAQVKNKYVN